MITIDVPAWPTPRGDKNKDAPSPERAFRYMVTGQSGYVGHGYVALLKGPAAYAVARDDPSPSDPRFKFRRTADGVSFVEAVAPTDAGASVRMLSGASFAVNLQGWQYAIDGDVDRSILVRLEETTSGAAQSLLGEWRFVEGEVSNVDPDCTESTKGSEWVVDMPMRLRFR
jgi:hypothetical protein